MVLRRKSKQKLPKTSFPHWNREMRGNFKAWGDPYKCISTDQNLPVPIAAPLPAVAAPALPPPFVPPPIILPPPPVNVVLPPAFVPQQPQGPRFGGPPAFGGLPAFHNPFKVLQQQQDDDDNNDDTLYENLDDTVVQQPQPSGTKTKPPFPTPRTTRSKTSSSSSSEGERLQPATKEPQPRQKQTSTTLPQKTVRRHQKLVDARIWDRKRTIAFSR